MSLKIYNTLTRQKEDFKTLENNLVKIYTCGPTVYYYAHIGNLRAYLFMDNLRRVLKYNGYELKHVMNITDVGHLVSDADEGEDKMIKAAKRENKDTYEIAQYYTKAFMEDIEKLNIPKPEIICKATEHIKEMESFVQEIIKNGYTYETEDTIYFDTSKLDTYGLLSGINMNEQKAGARVDFDSNKKNITDFALWIKAPKEHIMKWETFWGLCYPGWHIECSAMSRKYLGDVFDIHTGGIDHIPIHHENEIAQSKGATGKIPANYWMHCEFLLVDNGKMSKSLNNLYTLNDLKEKGYEPLVYRLFNFSSHYRNKINFTFEAMDSTKISLNRLREGIVNHLKGIEKIDKEILEDYRTKFKNAINDDLNMPVAMSVVWDIIKNEKKSKDFRDLICEFDKVLGLDLDKITKDWPNEEQDLPKEILNLIEQRKTARENKDFKTSDELRDKIIELGYNIKDTKEGMIVVKK